MTENRSAAIAAAIILLGFGLFAYFLPRLMLAAGALSPYLAGGVAALFIVALFLVLWLRAQVQRRKRRR
jgi:hypothetical protein